MRASGEAAAQLTWLSPCSASLLALARSSTFVADTTSTLWSTLRVDPAAVLLIARLAPRMRVELPFTATVADSAVLEGALELVRGSSSTVGFIDWSTPGFRSLYLSALTYARLAAHVANEVGGIDVDLAWAAGLVAPLGWYGLAAVDGDGVAACLADSAHSGTPATVQRNRWGIDQSSLARRLARRWRLPRWLSTSVGHLGLPADTAVNLGADPRLFALLQLAVGLAHQHGSRLLLAVGATVGEAAQCLKLSADQLKAFYQYAHELSHQLPTVIDSTSPHSQPLLAELLQLAVDHRRGLDAVGGAQLEQDLDALHLSLADQRNREAARLQTQKLNALAELAGGAGHEINNPLAVISGQAQYLLAHEHDSARQKALHTIIGQTQRIHSILTELMQFARPPQPRKEFVQVADLVREVVLSHGDTAERRKVLLVCPDSEPTLTLFADPRLIRTALGCLLRNAIEAAPADGWAGVRVVRPTPDQLEFVVEDNGVGPAPDQREHLFDPFYSSRQAGRGRGLGLPTAWRLAREHGGDVVLDERTGIPTRFILSLPLGLPPEFPPAPPDTQFISPTNGTAVDFILNGYDHLTNGSQPHVGELP